MKSASLQYANALADVALQQGAAEPALKQLNDFATAYSESAELRNFLASPAVTSKESPGRKKPTSRPVSTKTIAVRPTMPPTRTKDSTS